jgi:hypothetical protein
MRTIISILATSALLGATVPVFAYGSSSSDDRMICKRQKKTGTRFESKICKPASVWEAMAEENRRSAAEMANRPQIEIQRR